MPDRTILHVDMDAFFAAVEVLDDPSLRGKPVAVGGSPTGRGVITSATYEARAFGVRSAMPSSRALRLCPQLVFVGTRMGRYAEVSARLFEIFHDSAPLVEGLSIDEAFLDVTGCRRLLGDGETIARRLKQRIRDELGLVASVGVAPNKYLAKLASDLEKPDGLVVIRPDQVAERLADLPVRRLMGVGAVAAERLERLGIRRIRDVWRASREQLARAVGRFGPRLARLSRGQDDRPVQAGDGRRSIGAERTFARDLADPHRLRRVLDDLSERVTTRLRRQGLRARTVTVKARLPDFTTFTRSHSLPAPTDRTRLVRDTARDLLERKLAGWGPAFRLLGVSLGNLEEEADQQGVLFPDPEEVRDRRLDAAVDRIRARFGERVLARACQTSEPSPRHS